MWMGTYLPRVRPHFTNVQEEDAVLAPAGHYLHPLYRGPGGSEEGSAAPVAKAVTSSVGFSGLYVNWRSPRCQEREAAVGLGWILKAFYDDGCLNDRAGTVDLA